MIITALKNLLGRLAILWRSYKILQILVYLLTVSLIAAGTFIGLKEYQKRKNKVYAATAAIKVELPKGIQKEDLQNLSSEDRTKLDQKIAEVLKARSAEKKRKEEDAQSVVIVFTQNGQPILPDSEEETPSSRGEEKPSPTPIPCTDTDGGLDIFTKGTLTTFYGDTKTDFCTDPDIVGEYSCVPDGLFAFGGYTCPGACVDGACSRATPTPLPTTPLVNTPTPMPTYAPCVDTDGGIELYKYGEIIWNNKTDKDSCYLSGELTNSCSGNSCYLFEGYCENLLPVREIFKCSSGCSNGVCLSGPVASPTAASNKVPTSQPEAQVTPTQIPPQENNLTFILDSTLEQKYEEVNKRKLKNDVDKIYEAIKRLYGPPYRNMTVQIKLSEHSYYNLSLSEIGIADYNLESSGLLIYEILTAFHDVLIAFIPGTWEAGFCQVVGTEVNVELFMPERKNQARFYYPLYEIVAPNPSWVSQGGNFLAINDFLAANPHTLLYATLYKPFIEDNQFFVNFNRELYKLPVDSYLFYKMPMVLGMVKPEIEGEYFSDWFENQYILQILPLPGKFIIPYLEKNQAGKMVIYAKAVEVLENGNRVEAGGKSMTIHAYRPEDMEELWSTQRPTQDSEEVNFGEMPSGLVQYGNILFEIKVPGFNDASFYYPYWENQPLVFDGSPANGIFGSLVNAGGGELVLEASHTTLSKILDDSGVFDTRYSPQFHNTKGTVDLSYYAKTGDQTPTAVKKITKDVGDYYTVFQFSRSAASKTRGLSPIQDCQLATWTDYQNDKFGLRFKIPSGWTDDSSPERQSESLIYRTLISTLRPEEQLDMSYRLSGVNIIASKNDLKTDTNYKGLFEDYADNSQVSQINFKGVPAEKVVSDIKQPAGQMHVEQYYFQKGEIYYYLKYFIYVDSDLKDNNEVIMKCFLDNFNLIGLISCPDNLLSTDEEILQQANWQENPDECAKRPEQKICGHVRSTYDNGITQEGKQEYRNPYCFCSFFDKKGGRTFRGTKMVNLGYEEGPCR